MKTKIVHMLVLFSLQFKWGHMIVFSQLKNYKEALEARWIANLN